MDIIIGKMDRPSLTVPVTFRSHGKVHRRPVRAVLTARGRIDRKATRLRVDAVARAVAHKFALGLLADTSDES